ncbi:MAG: polyprenyl synthetase family protein [Gemmatimonadaceae bacterium]|nr:polyprenyl synthetase family protein [Gemmatimonadaceae bacterium]
MSPAVAAPAAPVAPPVAPRGAPSVAVASPPGFVADLLRYRDAVIGEMQSIIAEKGFDDVLARRMSDYPLRTGKGLRPALCLATCQAYGGEAAHALPTAVALELFHNAFLVHDDVEDESLHRRGAPTMHQDWGIAIAVNVGDALNVLAMTPLLNNLEVVGLEKTLRIFREIERMARESVEGQAMELEWVRANAWELRDAHYFRMSCKKTCWYTTITPCRLGALLGGPLDVSLEPWEEFGYHLGVAFQIQDDLLNLVGEEERYGKERAGDIWEGKRTLMLIQLLQRAGGRERQRILRVLGTPRARKTQDEVDMVLSAMERHGALDHGRELSRDFARQARREFETITASLPPSTHLDFIESMIDYVIHRDL